MESDRIHAAGAIMREAVDYDDAPGAEQGWLTGWRPTASRASRASTRARSSATSASAGAMRGGIFPADVPEAEARERIAPSRAWSAATSRAR